MKASVQLPRYMQTFLRAGLIGTVVLLAPLPAFAASTPSVESPLGACEAADLGEAALCGTLAVPENHAATAGRQLALRVVVLPATGKNPAPDPVFVLGGGPGQAITREAATLGVLMRAINERRDLVFIDQRGTGGSSPFNCDLGADGPQLTDLRFDPTSLAACLARTENDPRFYTTGVFIQDLNEIRQRLGYNRINVAGGSYGSWAAMSFARSFPQYTRAVVAHAVVPPESSFPAYFPRSFQRAITRLNQACARQAPCAEQYGNLEEKFTQTVQRLRSSANPPLEDDAFASAIIMRLYHPALAVDAPRVIDAGWRGDFSQLNDMPDLTAGISWGLFLSITCSEAMPRITDEILQRETRGSLFGMDFLDGLREACQHWPHQPQRELEITETNVPILFISGNEDPASPPDLAELAAESFPQSHHLVLEGQRHTPFYPACISDIAAGFIEKASADELDTACTDELAVPSFRTP